MCEEVLHSVVLHMTTGGAKGWNLQILHSAQFLLFLATWMQKNKLWIQPLAYIKINVRNLLSNSVSFFG